MMQQFASFETLLLLRVHKYMQIFGQHDAVY